MTTSPPEPVDAPPPGGPARPGISPLVWGLIAAVLAIGIAAVIIVAAANDDDEEVDLTNPGTTLPIDPNNTVPVTDSTLPPETVAPVTLPASCDSTVPAPTERPTVSAPQMTIDATKTYTATISTSCGDIVLALDAANAPTSVNNFVALARAGFYDGLTFHRVSPEFVIQGGDPNGDGSGGAGYTIESEGPPNDAYVLGGVAWAKGGSDPAGTASSQFFIITGETGATLPPDYGWIGTVSEGLDVAQTIESLGTVDGPPQFPAYILSVTISES